MKDVKNSLNIGSMIQPLADTGVFKVDGYHCWGPQLIRGEEGKYYLVYSRWAKEGGDWMTTSEIALAVADQLEGPYQHLNVLLTGRGAGHWNEKMAHNPKLKKFRDKYYLYFISSKSGPTRGHIRDSQRTGVAVSDSITGPYVPCDAPIVEPVPPVYNITVNPGITQMPDGRFLMMVKGDRIPKAPEDPMPQRVQGLAIADGPEGPFKILPDVAIKDIDTEDASIWYDEQRARFFAVFHAHTYIGLIESGNGRDWQKAEHDVITGNELKRADGSVLVTEEPLQRPSIFVEEGEPRALCLAVPEPDDWYCVILPLWRTACAGSQPLEE